MKSTAWFNNLKEVFWPVKRNEMKKFLLMSTLILLIVFMYSTLRNLKDAILVTSLGVEVISTLELYGSMPISILFMLLYYKLCNIFSREHLFYIFVTFFLSFFALFAFVIYPARADLTFNITHLVEEYPRMQYFFILASNWGITLFYIAAELWGTVILTLMFWQFANQVTTVEEARRFYGLFGVLGQLGMMFSGYIIKLVNDTNVGLGDNWEDKLFIFTSILLFSGLVVMGIYRLVNKHVMYNSEIMREKINSKLKLSLKESLSYVFSSKYLGLIALLSISYAITLHLTETLWKGQIKLQYPDSQGYSAFVGELQIYFGFGTMICTLIGAYLVKHFSWVANALITPIVMLVTGTVLFMMVIFRDSFDMALSGNFAYTALMLSILFGAFQYVVTKSSKYSVFDATKEMAYIPLDPELQSKGKAAADVVGHRVGKAGGSFIQWILLMIMPGVSLQYLSPEIFVIFVLTIIIWLLAVLRLNKAFTKMTQNQTEKL